MIAAIFPVHTTHRVKPDRLNLCSLRWHGSIWKTNVWQEQFVKPCGTFKLFSKFQVDKRVSGKWHLQKIDHQMVEWQYLNSKNIDRM